MYTDEHVGEAPISSPPDEASRWRDVCVVHMRRDILSELALASSGGGALPHGSRGLHKPCHERLARDCNSRGTTTVCHILLLCMQQQYVLGLMQESASAWVTLRGIASAYVSLRMNKK